MKGLIEDCNAYRTRTCGFGVVNLAIGLDDLTMSLLLDNRISGLGAEHRLDLSRLA